MSDRKYSVEKVQLSNWLKKIEEFHPKNIDLGLERVHKIAFDKGLLKLNAKVITVAGTNGKGSCIATIESLALQAKLNVGIYTSPHLIDFNERIRLSGKNVQDQTLIEAFNKVEGYREGIELTFFEFTTLAAFYIFSKRELDLIVLEVGLGGRLDAVNVIDPDVAILTTVEKDHMDWLGNNLSDIAYEKSGIFRQNSLNLVGDKRSANLINEHRSLDNYKIKLVDSKAIKDDYGINYDELIDNYKINKFQLLQQNIELALSSFNYLFNNKTKTIDLKGVISSIILAGRFHVMSNKPLIIADVAHNCQAALNLAKQMKALACHGKRIAICGLMSDKMIGDFLSELDDSIDQWIFVGLPTGRASKPSDLLSLYKTLFKHHKAVSFQNVSEAVNSVNNQLSESDHLYILGSFITVSEYIKKTGFKMNQSLASNSNG